MSKLSECERGYRAWISPQNKSKPYMKREPKITNAMWAKLRLSKAQIELQAKHGTPSEFASAVYKCVPSEISMAEAASAIEEYLKEWIRAAQ